MKKAMVMMAALLVLVWMVGLAWAGDLEPSGPPGPTMKTLGEIYEKIEQIASPQILTDTSTILHAGYYEATDLTDVDGDLISENIKKDISIFGVVGSLNPSYSAGIPVTGQTTQYTEGDDGFYRKGVPSPTPRFSVGSGDSYNCVTDTQTGLVWLRNPDAGIRSWADSIAYCESLSGSDGRGGFTDWRLPNLRELHSLVDYGEIDPPLPADHPFVGVEYSPTQNGRYWSSTTGNHNVTQAWVVGFRYYGEITYQNKTSTTYFTWPVRGGQ